MVGEPGKTWKICGRFVEEWLAPFEHSLSAPPWAKVKPQ